jgi:preprotein translocase subunit YajC
VNNIILVLATAGQSGQSGQGSPLGFFLPIILIFGIMYLLIFRPQAKKQKEHRQMLESIEKGDRVLTAGGIYGTVVGVKEKEGILIVKVADNVKMEMSKTAIAKKLTAGSK